MEFLTQSDSSKILKARLPPRDHEIRIAARTEMPRLNKSSEQEDKSLYFFDKRRPPSMQQNHACDNRTSTPSNQIRSNTTTFSSSEQCAVTLETHAETRLITELKSKLDSLEHSHSLALLDVVDLRQRNETMESCLKVSNQKLEKSLQSNRDLLIMKNDVKLLVNDRITLHRKVKSLKREIGEVRTINEELEKRLDKPATENDVLFESLTIENVRLKSEIEFLMRENHYSRANRLPIGQDTKT